MKDRRLVAVLGYSDSRERGLHPVCAARLRLAAQDAKAEDTVLLSGWARRKSHAAEAELMARAWRGRSSAILLDRTARSTYGNVVGVAAAARSLSIGEVVLVTSSWHGRRAATLLRAALRGTGLRVSVSTTEEARAVRPRLRELACWALVPFQAGLAARSR